MGYVMDFMPTFIEISGAKYPKTFKGHAITPFNGISMVPSFKGNEKQSHTYLYNEHYRARYIRDAEWKMVSLANDTSWHLYKINSDETELNDLTSKYPEVVNRLSNQWREWANNHHVFPKPVVNNQPGRQ
jgi:arylsulfatase